MAYAHTTHTAHGIGQILRRTGAAILEVLEIIATAGPKSAALRRLTQTTDEQLAARGTTRDAEVRRIMGLQPYI